jgi:hypothetical protein
MGRKKDKDESNSGDERLASDGGTVYGVRAWQETGDGGRSKAKKDAVAELLGGQFEPDIVEDVRRFR